MKQLFVAFSIDAVMCASCQGMVMRVLSESRMKYRKLINTYIKILTEQCQVY